MINRYENCTMSVQDTDGVQTLVIAIVIDPERVDVQPSQSGKTDVFATTGGAVLVPGSDGLKVNLTVYRKR